MLDSLESLRPSSAMECLRAIHAYRSWKKMNFNGKRFNNFCFSVLKSQTWMSDTRARTHPYSFIFNALIHKIFKSQFESEKGKHLNFSRLHPLEVLMKLFCFESWTNSYSNTVFHSRKKSLHKKETKYIFKHTRNRFLSEMNSVNKREKKSAMLSNAWCSIDRRIFTSRSITQTCFKRGREKKNKNRAEKFSKYFLLLSYNLLQ